jgi:transglutaminase-like putative cysteine protease
MGLFILSAAVWTAARGAGMGLMPEERTFLIEESIVLKNLPEHTEGLRIWIPYPASDKWQSVSDFSIRDRSSSGKKLFNKRILTDKKYRNKVIYLSGIKQDLSEIMLAYKIERKEYAGPVGPASFKRFPARFLKPNRLVPVNDRLRALAEKIAQGKTDNLNKVRAIYDYIINELTYSKDDPAVCGIGNSLLTLEAKKGICTDYHSLFISLVRSLGIPAKFEIGYRIPNEKGEGTLGGYHCWAKFYLKDKGWIPVDISEADKHPERRDYFFGNIDENRFHLVTGRDIKLKYSKNSEPFNFFVYPYAEFEGKRFDDIDVEIQYRDLRGGV